VFVINSTVAPNRGVNPSGDSSIAGLFSQTTFSYYMVDLIAGLRYDRYTLDGSGSVTAANPLFPKLPAGPYTIDRDDDRFDPKITLAAHVTSWLQPYITYAEAMRAPTVSETLTGGQHPATGGPMQMFFPNPFLDPEIQKGWEYGANVVVDGLFDRKDHFRFKGDYFEQDIENCITACFTAMGGTYFCNAPGISNVWGVELQGSYDAGYVFTGLGYTHTHTDLPSQVGGFGASQYLPEDVLTLTGGLRFLQQKLTIGAREYIVSKAYNGADQVQALLGPGAPASSNPNGNPLDPFSRAYQLLDLFGSYRFDSGTEVGFTVTNVFDRSYTPALSTPTTNFIGDTGRGRTFLLTTRAQF
jgi:hemoglobin/transferrin/lactoferrin receptor protein